MPQQAFKAGRIAKALGMGKWTLQRVVSESLGIPLGYWLRMERAVAAAYRLRELVAVDQLAKDYGFKHQGDFSEKFKRWYNVYPADFLRTVESRKGSGAEVEQCE